MGGFSLWHWLIVGVVILLLFGKGRFSDMMGDVAKGLKSFKKGMTDEDEVKPQERSAEQRQIPPQPPIDITPRPADQTASPPPASPTDDQIR